MEETNLISNILNWDGVQTKLTWYPGTNIDNFQPFNQVYGVVFDNTGRMLIQKVEDSDWCLAGGTVEAGETALETLVREIIEEADVTIKNPILLGGQRIQFMDGHNPNPSKRGGDDFYQLRFYCELDEILSQTPDPDHGKIHERLFVSPEELTKYFDWGVTGKVIFDQATALWKELHPEPPDE